MWTFKSVKTKEGYITGYYSLLDSQEIQFSAPVPQNKALLKAYENLPQMKTLLYITNGYYTVEKQDPHLKIHDLRFGDFGGWNGKPGKSVFAYLFDLQTQTFTQAPRDVGSPAQLLPGLWERVKGN